MSAAVIGLILLAAFVLCTGITYLWSIFRGLAKTRMRVVLILLSAVLAVISTLIAKSMIATERVVSGVVVPLLEHMNVEGIGELIGMSETLNEVLLGCIGAIIAPILCLCFFWVWCLITWIAYVIISLCMNEEMKEYDKRIHLKPLRILAWAVGSTLISFAILLIPVSVYSRIAPVIVTELIDAEVVEGEGNQSMQALVDDYINPINENPMTATYRFLGGDGLDHLITDFKVRGVKTHLEDELGAVASFGCNIYNLSKTELAEYGEHEAIVILAVADSFDRSELLPTIVGEVIYNATDAWIEGEDFLGIQKPNAGELFNPFLDVLFEILHEDSQDTSALQADIRTIANMISTLAKHEIFAHLSDPDALISKLDGAGAINDLVTCLGSNESMKVLIPEITNLGIRAIADTLGIPADSVEIYETFMDDVADDLNELKSLSGEARVDALNEKLAENFDKAGIQADPEILDCYSVSIANDLLDQAEGDITADDVRAFFVLYAMNAAKEEEQEKDPTDPVSYSGLFAPTLDADVFKGTVYENMTEEQLAKTGAATLAQVTNRLSTLEGEDIPVQALSIVLSEYTNLLGAENDQLAVLSRINVTSAISTEVIEGTASLQSSEELGKTTMRVTVDMLVVKSKEAAELINSTNLGKEVDVIQAVIRAAGEVLGNTDSLDMSNLNTIASSVGKVLDSLSQSGSFGADQTADLFKAVLQSDQIRKAADLDMETATKLSDKATETPSGETVDYSATLSSVSGSITVVTQMGKGEEIKDEDLVEMIQNLTPSTAGMIEVYVTPGRMVGYGVPEKTAPMSASMLSSIFGYLAEDDVEDFDAEAAALNQMLRIAMSAKESKEKELFGGILPGASETVNTLLGSKAVQHSLVTNMTDGEKVTEFDPFELGSRTQGESSADEVAEFTAALHAYYAQHPETDVLVLEALAATFGITVTF